MLLKKLEKCLEVTGNIWKLKFEGDFEKPEVWKSVWNGVGNPFQIVHCFNKTWQ